MRVLVAGSSGLIGSALLDHLRGSGHEVRRLVRRMPRLADEFGWDPPAGRIDDGAFDGVDAVVNLCGSPLASGRWSGARKQLLTDSRLEPTEVLAEAVADHGVGALLNASGISYYGDTGSAEVDESARAGSGFLAGLCVAWEAATTPATKAGARVVLLRTAPVLSSRGGMLRMLLPLFRLGLGARLGSGSQYLPWISLRDQVSAITFLLERVDITGAVNLTSPSPVTNAEFTRELARAVHRPAPWFVPALALKAALGEAAEETLLSGPRAVPGVLRDGGFDFADRELDDALALAV
ncbi:hypothetical protein FHU38_003849 [Saccharomonospora amisosensis]|uniref:TIGR01777 family protein n=1 Tax=Saccharomonospora amisosensis TaxID=1128677 RepID=A0A7X5USS0_9PSEU|nr:TIGR01777 family oxidoreductase [Saccharomonospora amisosensis]NIJ13505.1 hypothetical protein [Saccharomonospora amisosensis]